MIVAFWVLAFILGTGAIVWGAEAFAEHLGAASVRLGVSAFAFALLLAGAEPEELATVVTAALRGAPGIALGDVIGANATVCFVALGLGAWLAPLPFRRDVMRYALLGLPLGVIAAWMAWNGHVSRIEGGVLILLYGAFVAIIWRAERRPPALGEVGELIEAQGAAKEGHDGGAGLDVFMALAGVAAMAGGATLLVAAVQRMGGDPEGETRLGLTIVGFATGFELVVLAWSASRRGISEAVVAGVVGSFAYNVTMTLGAGALARPLTIADAAMLHLPLIMMIAALALVVLLASRQHSLGRFDAIILLLGYAIFIAVVLTV
jgi:cation:H+ antiporter